MAGYERDIDRPSSGRETGTGMGTESGESGGVFVAEYDLVPESDRLTRSDVESGKDGQRSPMVTRLAEGESVEMKGVAAMAKGSDVKMTGVSAVVSGEKVEMTGWAPVAMASKEVEIEKGAAFLALAGKKVEVEENGYLAFGVAPRIEVEEGGKVFVTLPMAIVAGLAFGVGWVVAGVLALVWLRRQGGLRGMMMRRRARAMGLSRMQSRMRGMRSRMTTGDD